MAEHTGVVFFFLFPLPCRVRERVEKKQVRWKEGKDTLMTKKKNPNRGDPPEWQRIRVKESEGLRKRGKNHQKGKCAVPKL